MPTLYSEWCPICGFKHNRPSEQIEHAREKACESCGAVKPLSDYPRNNGSWDGHRKICETCAAAQKVQVAAKKAEEKAVDEAKPLLLVLPAFPQHVNINDLPEHARKVWVRGKVVCASCKAELPTVQRHSQKGQDFEICRPFSPVFREEDDNLYASSQVWYCSESCYEAQHTAHIEQERRRYEEFRASLGVKLADALANSPRHVAFNQMGSCMGVYPIEYAEVRPDGKIVAHVYEFEGESRDIIADTAIELDEALFTGDDGYWSGPEYWYPDK
jgi:hypothetical protein